MPKAQQRNIFAAVKREVKAADTTVDEFGQKRGFEVTEDEDQNLKLDEIVQLLLAAGYFRARIKGLSPFDKIVGGMVWCITASNEDVDVDILFEENASIGKKIALTEKIVAALPRLKCPLRLEPHQIQGLDNVSIFPVVQWLVKKALETREEMEEQQRNSAVHEFDKFGVTPADASFKESLGQSTQAVRVVQTIYGANRILKAPNTDGADQGTKVHCTLLEYGRRYGGGKIPKSTKDDSKRKSGEATEEELRAKEEKRVKAILKKMNKIEDKGVSSTALDSIAALQSQEIKTMSEEYAKQAASLAASQQGKESGEKAHKRAVASLQKQTDVLESKIASASAEKETLSGSHAERKAAYLKVRKYSKKIDAGMAELDALEGDDANKDAITKLRKLVGLNDALKSQEASFKTTCKSEMASLEEKIEKLEGAGIEIYDDERTRAIAEQFKADQEKMKKLKLLNARRTREMATLQRQIDEFPGRGELNQYQRRFVELYAAINTKLRETKQYYTLYNSLDDMKLYLAKENQLLESIQSNYTVAIGSSSGKEQLLKQMKGIVDALNGNKSKVTTKFESEQTTRDTLSEKLNGLISISRQYYKAVKDYESEIGKNEILESKLEKRNAKKAAAESSA